jgi:hypothetical protein
MKDDDVAGRTPGVMMPLWVYIELEVYQIVLKLYP